eukprot:tig00000144_g9087.t1
MGCCKSKAPKGLANANDVLPINDVIVEVANESGPGRRQSLPSAKSAAVPSLLSGAGPERVERSPAKPSSIMMAAAVGRQLAALPSASSADLPPLASKSAADTVLARTRTVRVYVSTTYPDMTEEREELQKLAPELQRVCAQRDLFFLLVDMRWQATTEQHAGGDVLRIALEEIERSTYFVGVLAERYGWHERDAKKPRDKVLTATLDRAQPAHAWLAQHRDRSLTEIEIQYAALLGDAPTSRRSFFYLRDPRSGASQAAPAESPEAAARLNELKAAILERSGGRVLQNFHNAASFAYACAGDIAAAVEADFGAGAAGPMARDVAEETGQRLAARAALAAHVPDAQALQDIANYCANPSGVALLVSGAAGAGKTTLFASFAHRFKRDEGAVLLEHHFAATGESARLSTLLRRLETALKMPPSAPFDGAASGAQLARQGDRWLESEGAALGPSLRARAMAEMRAAQLLAGALSRAPAGTVLLLDGLDELAAEWPFLGGLEWVPRRLPPGVALVLSAAGGRPLEAARQRNWPETYPSGLAQAQQAQAAQLLLRAHGRRLDAPLVELLTADEEKTGYPLFLRLVAEELRPYTAEQADQARLEQTIVELLVQPTLPALYRALLRRWAKEWPRAAVPAALTYIALTPDGLAESEILALTRAPAREWAGFAWRAGPTLENRSGLLRLGSPYLREAVEAEYDAAEGSHRAALAHRELAAFFKEAPQGPGRKGRREFERLEHLRGACDAEELLKEVAVPATLLDVAHRAPGSLARHLRLLRDCLPEERIAKEFGERFVKAAGADPEAAETAALFLYEAGLPAAAQKALEGPGAREELPPPESGPGSRPLLVEPGKAVTQAMREALAKFAEEQKGREDDERRAPKERALAALVKEMAAGRADELNRSLWLDDAVEAGMDAKKDPATAATATKARALLLQARTFTATARLPAAGRCLHAARAGLEACGHSRTPLYPKVLHGIADYYLANLDDARAVKYANLALYYMLQDPGSSLRAAAAVLDTKASALYATGDFEAAVLALRIALSMKLAVFGPAGPAVYEGYSRLGRAYRALGMDGRARRSLEQAIPGLEGGEGGPGGAAAPLAEALAELALVLHSYGQAGEAGRVMERAIGLQKELHGERAGPVARSYAALGAILEEAHEYDRAVGAYDAALVAACSTGNDSPHYVSIARCHVKAGREEEGLWMLRQNPSCEGAPLLLRRVTNGNDVFEDETAMVSPETRCTRVRLSEGVEAPVHPAHAARVLGLPGVAIVGSGRGLFAVGAPRAEGGWPELPGLPSACPGLVSCAFASVAAGNNVIIVVGTSEGGVAAFSLAAAVLEGRGPGAAECVAAGNARLRLTKLEGPTTAVAAADAGRVVVAARQHVAFAWDLEDPARKAVVFKGHARPITALAAAARQARLYTAAEDETVRAWDAAGGCLWVAEAAQGPARGLSLLEEANALHTASDDCTLRSWQEAGGTCSHTRHISAPTGVALSFTRRRLAVACASGELLLYSVPGLRRLTRLGGPMLRSAGRIVAMAVADYSCGYAAVTAHATGAVIVHAGIADKEQRKQAARLAAGPTGVAILPRERLAVVSDAAGAVNVVDFSAWLLAEQALLHAAPDPARAEAELLALARERAEAGEGPAAGPLPGPAPSGEGPPSRASSRAPSVDLGSRPDLLAVPAAKRPPSASSFRTGPSEWGSPAPVQRFPGAARAPAGPAPAAGGLGWLVLRDVWHECKLRCDGITVAPTHGFRGFCKVPSGRHRIDVGTPEGEWIPFVVDVPAGEAVVYRQDPDTLEFEEDFAGLPMARVALAGGLDHAMLEYPAAFSMAPPRDPAGVGRRLNAPGAPATPDLHVTPASPAPTPPPPAPAPSNALPHPPPSPVDPAAGALG